MLGTVSMHEKQKETAESKLHEEWILPNNFWQLTIINIYIIIIINVNVFVIETKYRKVIKNMF